MSQVKLAKLMLLQSTKLHGYGKVRVHDDCFSLVIENAAYKGWINLWLIQRQAV